MKRIISSILILAFVLAALSAISPTASAKGETISEREAKSLVDSAYDAYYVLSRYEDLFYCEDGFPWPDRKLTRKDDATGRQMTYMEVYDPVLPGDSYDGFFKYSDSIFTPEVSAKFSSQSYQYNDFPLFIEENGVYYVALSNLIVNHEYNDFMYDKSDGSVIITEGNENYAKAVVLCEVASWIPITDRAWKRQIDYAEVECLFEKTPKGWRIAESSFASMLTAYGKIEYEPYSGDLLNLRYFELLLVDIMSFYGTIQSRMPYDENEYIVPFGENFGNVQYSADFARYFLVKEDELPGGSYEGLVKESKKYFTDAAADIFLNYYAIEQNIPLFYVQDGKRYAYYESNNPWQFGDNLSFFGRGNGRPTIDSLVINDDRATGTVICHQSAEDHPKEMGYTLYAFDVVFVKNEQGWVLDDCEYLRAKTGRTSTNEEYDRYLVKDISIYQKYGVGIPSYIDFDSPSTGDNLFDTIAICLGGMAIVMSALCLIRRKREIL